MFDTIDTHTAGEPTRLITGGVPDTELSGTVMEQRDQFASDCDDIRRLLLTEPRGHKDMFGAMAVEPDHPDASLGLFFMDSKGYLDMCGHGTIGAITALVETGRLEHEPSSDPLLIETPAGLVSTEVKLDSGSVERVNIQNVSAFYHGSSIVEIDSLGSVPVDIVYAGNFFAMVNSHELDINIGKKSYQTLVEYGIKIRQAVNNQESIYNPFTDSDAEVKLTEFYELNDPVDRNVTVFGSGQIDRSPCGTGTCAKMALLYERDKLDVGVQYPHESIIGTQFTGSIADTFNENGREIIDAQVSGSAYIIAKNTFFLDPHDPISGFILGDNGN